MDTALRRAEREGDWRARATALRRAGRSNEARRVVSDAAAHDPEAFSLLDAWFPLSDEERGLLAQIVRPVARGWRVHSKRVTAVKELIGVGDPRFDAALRSFEEVADADDWLAPAVQAVLALEGGFTTRLVGAVRMLGSRVLARVQPTPDEVVALLEAFRRPAEPQGWDPVLQVGGETYRVPDLDVVMLTTVAFAGRWGDERAVPFLRPLLEHAALHPLLRQQVWAVLSQRGEAAGPAPALADGRPVRPDWVDPGALPLELRDPVTLGILRKLIPAAHRPDDAVIDRNRQLLLLDLDSTKRFNDRHGHHYGDELLFAVTETLQRVFGDRVIRYAGDEWLIPWEGEGLLEVAEAARLAVHALPDSPPTGDSHGHLIPAISGGIGHSIRAAEEALHAAKRAGGNHIVGP